MAHGILGGPHEDANAAGVIQHQDRTLHGLYRLKEHSEHMQLARDEFMARDYNAIGVVLAQPSFEACELPVLP